MLEEPDLRLWCCTSWAFGSWYQIAGNRQFTRQPRRRFSYTVAESEASIMISRLRASDGSTTPTRSFQPATSENGTLKAANWNLRRRIRCETRLLPPMGLWRAFHPDSVSIKHRIRFGTDAIFSTAPCHPERPSALRTP